MSKLQNIKPFHHFAERLKERYGIEINVFDYLDLIQSPAENLKDNHDGTLVVKIKVNGTAVFAVKQKNRNKFLLTALPDIRDITNYKESKKHKKVNP